MERTLTKEQKDLLDGFGIIPGMDSEEIRKQMRIHNGCMVKTGYDQIEITKNLVFVNNIPFRAKHLRDALLKG